MFAELEHISARRSLQSLVGYGLAYRKAVRRQRGRAYEYVVVPKKEAKKSY